MSDLNYGFGFYLIKIDDSHYDLYNSLTDKRILLGEPTESIASFLELNLPTHPFLYQLDQEAESYSDDHSEEENYYKTNNTPPYCPSYTSMPLGEDMDISNYNSYYSGFNYSNADYCSGLSVDDMEQEGDSIQLEFGFTYKDNKTNSSPNSPDIEDYDIPYLPDDNEK